MAWTRKTPLALAAPRATVTGDAEIGCPVPGSPSCQADGLSLLPPSVNAPGACTVRVHDTDAGPVTLQLICGVTVLPDTPSKLIGPDVTARVGGTGVAASRAFGWTVAATGTVARRVQAGRQPGGGVFVAVDVHYLPGGGARAAAVVAADAAFCHLLADRIGQVAEVPPYQPGQFCLRELPPLHAVLDGLDGMRLLIVDGYADLDLGGRPGLGAHAHTEFGCWSSAWPRTGFRAASHAVPAGRGEGFARPLYVTAAGLPRHDAADLVQHMAGRYRLPDALRRADALARGRSRRS